MFFLIEYDRPKGKIVNLQRFADSERLKAENTRLQRELNLSRENMSREIVLLEAASEDALRKTHRRYFENYTQIGSSSILK